MTNFKLKQTTNVSCKFNKRSNYKLITMTPAWMTSVNITCSPVDVSAYTKTGELCPILALTCLIPQFAPPTQIKKGERKNIYFKK